jgi:hypothetical protein
MDHTAGKMRSPLQPLITVHLDQLGMSPETKESLLNLIDRDVERLARHPPLAAPFDYLSREFGGSEAIVLRFRAAWTLMYAAISRLDALQDGDPVDVPPHIHSPGAHYNLVFASYILSTSLLGELSERVSASRLGRLHQLWARSMLRMADGQQQDLASATSPRSFDAFDTYQRIAQAKTGATYALAFGGMATLLSEDEALQQALALVGELYGTLVQFNDDLRDAASQPNAALTLPELLRFVPLKGELPQEQLSAAFWSYLYSSYLQAAHKTLESYPSLRGAVGKLFAHVFIASGEQGAP